MLKNINKAEDMGTVTPRLLPMVMGQAIRLPTAVPLLSGLLVLVPQLQGLLLAMEVLGEDNLTTF